jgi:hypothetical protein
MENRIFVFGSNEAGIHGAGAAKYALNELGAQWGVSYGMTGKCFAIPTKDRTLTTLTLKRIRGYVEGFLSFAHGHQELVFQVSCIGCGLAGLKHKQIAPMFMDAPGNCEFDILWKGILGLERSYWGTYP